MSNDDGDDLLTISLSNDNGGSWTTPESINNTGGGGVHTIRIADVMTPTDQMLLHLTVADQPNNSLTEAALDAVMIFEVGCGGIPGDINGDGVVNTVDLLLLLAAWGPCAPPCPEDLDFNGVVDIDDLFAVLGAWGPC